MTSTDDSVRVLGLNFGRTRFGEELYNGGACLIEDGTISIAIAEERLTRKKADGGYENAIDYCLTNCGYDLNDIDSIVHSTCNEPMDRELERFEFDESDAPNVHPVSHHLSHAYSAFHPSGFNEALVVVVDAGGNVLENSAGEKWWRLRREQQSYYLGNSNSINLLHRDFDQPYDAGIAEIYSAFTSYLGFGARIYSGKTMGLAAHGDPNEYNDHELLYVENGRMKSNVRNRPDEPIRMVREFADERGIDFGEPRGPDEEIKTVHEDMAAFLQKEVERVLVSKITHLCNEYAVRNLAMAGGVALNCVANARILEGTPVRKMFVQPAAGDQGQCLGNALYGYHDMHGEEQSEEMDDVFYGKEYDLDEQSLSRIFDDAREEGFTVRNDVDIPEFTAKKLATQEVVALFQGRSEFGPRALGHRCLLCDPRDYDPASSLDNVKDRLRFRPYAPSVIDEHVAEWFENDWLQPNSTKSENMSEFMIVIGTLKEEQAVRVPAVKHVDNSSRLQVVRREVEPRYYDIMSEFNDLSGIPMVLNTSLNRKDEPICETPRDAYDCFKSTGIDAIILGDWVIEK